MRQAGRYLPEYREVRAEHPSFLDLCYSPEAACEVTLQPIRRYGFDASILFSDILVIPDALGVDVRFEKGEGPVLNLLSENADVFERQLKDMREKREEAMDYLAPVFNVVKKIRANLPDETDLIGFSGAPWTVFLYMMDPKPSKGSERSRTLFYAHPKLFKEAMDLLVDVMSEYLVHQINAGAQAVQLFDSWASQVPPAMFDAAVKTPLLDICRRVKAAHPDVPILLFPRGVSEQHLLDLVKEGKGLFEGLSLDFSADLQWAADNLQDDICLQGNLDPAVLLATPDVVRKAAEDILRIATQKPGFVFNLGHGIVPQTPPENVQVLMETIHAWPTTYQKTGS